MTDDKQTSTPSPRQPVKGGTMGRRQGRATEGVHKSCACGEEREGKLADGYPATALTASERREIDDKQPPRVAILYEVTRVQGGHEL